MTQGDRDGDRLRVLANRQVANVADQLRKSIFELELVDEQ
jgi:hypothetical protein